jgi:hypothetical protein
MAFEADRIEWAWRHAHSCWKETPNPLGRIYPFDPVGCRTMDSEMSGASCHTGQSLVVMVGALFECVGH